MLTIPPFLEERRGDKIDKKKLGAGRHFH
jgi:hypothetical protein